MALTAESIGEKLRIPDLLRAAPQARGVLDRYGLRGCGGVTGPQESLGFFAKAHDVPLDRLIAELQESMKQPANKPAPLATDSLTRLADEIYRPFFKSGIAVVLTLGAAWGAYLLLRIAFENTFSAAGLHEINAHGHAQIFGWVGLFVMGFAYQALPRFKHSTLPFPRIALLSFWLMVIGLIARSVLEPLAQTYDALIDLAVAASFLEVVAIGLFAVVVSATLRSSGKPLAAYDYYVVSSLFWFVIQAVYESIYLAATLSVQGDALIQIVATWQAPLRDIQIHGFAMLMILGMSQRIFHHFYDLPAPSSRTSLIALVALNMAVAGEALGLVLMRTVGHLWATLWYGSVILLAVTTVWLVGNWNIFSKAKEPDRSLKFLRTAYLWLFVSLGMLVFLPVYQAAVLPALAPTSEAVQIGFSHAYYGAIRHAITVGFISLMIVGVAAKVVPTLNGVDVHALRPLWLPYVLINSGCMLRVVAQALTDFTPSSFPLAGLSGLLEVTGLALWGVHLWRIMAGHHLEVPQRTRDQRYTWLLPGAPIEASHRVGDILNQYPALLPTFLAFGFQPLANPLLRRTVARHVTVERACRVLNVNRDELLGSLNAQLHPDNNRLTLPLLEHAEC
jgi:hypothetical protein